MCYRLGSGKKKSEFVRIQNPAHESIKRYEENVLIKKGTGTDIRTAGQKGHKKAYRTEVERSLLFHSLDSRAKAEYLEHTAGADELAGAGGTPVVMKAVRTEIHHYLPYTENQSCGSPFILVGFGSDYCFGQKIVLKKLKDNHTSI